MFKNKLSIKYFNMKTVYILLISVLLALFFLSFASALTAKIGNGRMVLYSSEGETLDKSIRVINDNDFSIKIQMNATGSLEEYITLDEPEFTLEAGDEKNATFTLTTPKTGVYNSTIIVKFIPVDTTIKQNPIALSSTIILISQKTGNYTGDVDNTDTGDDSGSDSGSDNTKPGWKTILFSVLGICAVVFVIVLVFLMIKNKRGNKKGETKPKKRASE